MSSFYDAVEAQSLTTVLSSLQPIMISRFLINLRQAASTGGSGQRGASSFSVANFRIPSLNAVIGNMSEPLAFGRNENGEKLNMDEQPNGTDCGRQESERDPGSIAEVC